MPRMLVMLLVISVACLCGCQSSEPVVPPPDAPTIPKVRNGQEHGEKLKKNSSAISPLRYALIA
jgi:hypothetical protein